MPEDPGNLRPSMNFREHRKFQQLARELVRLPRPGEGPLDCLLPEAQWQRLCRRAADPPAWLMALSQATGVYFFPSREWVPLLVRYLKLLGIKRLLEAGAGRGYLTGALAPLAAAAGLDFRAVDRGDGEFMLSGLEAHPRVESGDVFSVIGDFQPDAVVYAWPPPGQSLAALCRTPALRYLIVPGEVGGGATGAREDWERLPHKISPALSRYCRSRTWPTRHAVTIFYGGTRG